MCGCSRYSHPSVGRRLGPKIHLNANLHTQPTIQTKDLTAQLAELEKKGEEGDKKDDAADGDEKEDLEAEEAEEEENDEDDQEEV